MLNLKFLISLSFISGCATLPKNTSEIKSSRVMVLPTPIAAKNAQNFMVNYAIQKKSESVEVLICDNFAPQAVLLNHSDFTEFNTSTFCQTSIAQVFLQAGYNVIGINRPGFGRSTGKKDLAGQKSIEAINSGVKAALQKSKATSSLVGSWGYGSGGTAAGMSARNFKSLKWIMLGNTVYDFEQQTKNKQSKFFTPAIVELRKSEGDAAIERRSLAFETEGLPRQVFLFHSRQNQEVELSQMTQFADGLIAQQFQVKTAIIESNSQEINELDQYNVIKDFLGENN